ncbi:MAG: ATP-binding protein [Bacteroidota bacterium]|nr:ATP-binding protein [Bacteroidota bacterium]MDP4255998.1 ATP-binding protein [Bacteroidota bacterium]MDP4257475.1 ATP-binding protein [Bacteroidota bacterium]
MLVLITISAICFALSPYMAPQLVAFILLLALSLIAMFFDILPVLLSALVSALIWDYFFLLPRYNLRVGNTGDRILLSMYFVIALVNAVLTFKIRQMEKEARDKEEKAKTLKLYNTLLNSLSHEFRTPIATIIGATDNLLAEPSRLTGTDSRRLLTEISRASMRLNRQVENLLNTSRLESGFIRPRKEWCDLRELISSTIQHLDEWIGRHLVKVEIRKGFPLVRLDYGLMEQVLTNLVYNAALYTPAGSTIRITADCEDENLIIIVEDNGPGLPPAEIDKVFDKFYRPELARTGGVGLGLSIVKGFVEAHSGAIELKNIPAGGARFVIRMPVEKLSIKQTGKWVTPKY